MPTGIIKRADRSRGGRKLPPENEKVLQAIRSSEGKGKRLLDRWQEEGVTQEEVEKAMADPNRYTERLKAAGRRPRNRKVLGDITYGEVEQAIWRSEGMITKVASQLKIPVSAVKNIFKRNKMLEMEFDEFRERFNDEIEQALREAAMSGDVKAISFYLSRKARDRGYSEKDEDLSKRKRGVKLKIVKAEKSASKKTNVISLMNNG
jgi:hypothetical protein